MRIRSKVRARSSEQSMWDATLLAQLVDHNKVFLLVLSIMDS